MDRLDYLHSRNRVFHAIRTACRHRFSVLREDHILPHKYSEEKGRSDTPLDLRIASPQITLFTVQESVALYSL